MSENIGGLIHKFSLTRSDAMSVTCPHCRSPAGKKCMGRRKVPLERSSQHLDRYVAVAKKRGLI